MTRPRGPIDEVRVPEPRRILVVRPRAAGDVLLATPVLRALRERFPSAWIAFGVRRNMAPLAAGNPHVNEVIVLDAHESRNLPFPIRWARTAAFHASLARARYDWAIDLHGGPRSALAVLATGAPVRVGYDTRVRRRAYTIRVPRFERDAWGKPVVRPAVRVNASLVAPLGVEIADASLVLAVSEAARARIASHLAAAGRTRARPLVLLNPAAKWATKAWPADRYAALARRLAERADVIVLWGPGEREVAESVARDAGAGAPPEDAARRSAEGAAGTRITLAPPGDLGDVAALVERADLVVGTDSGVSHIAAALRIPSVTLFGPTNPAEWHAYDPARHVAVFHRVPCSFCNLTACAWHACLRELPIEAVHAACARLLADPPPRERPTGAAA